MGQNDVRDPSETSGRLLHRSSESGLAPIKARTSTGLASKRPAFVSTMGGTPMALRGGGKSSLETSQRDYPVDTLSVGRRAFRELRLVPYLAVVFRRELL